ncbi:membrane protein [Vibrio ichthyoenteri ATCC 700023]|uniref:Membrane protein n=1 Tax=Vibrio ichthyoenteri ATCC 700023 TaxID=870968 RepID=F9RYJ7_9VIBR|nr:hypothetical protein [Vibrio ichthyoenteri]EGU46414.1 membrane protein [Vibrio ichthyoenteri ATCC 700023]
MPNGQLTEMAMSIYLVWLIALIIAYPFMLVTAQIITYGEYNKKRYTKRINLLCAAAFMILLVLHLQTEVFYGKELLDWLNTSAN